MTTTALKVQAARKAGLELRARDGNGYWFDDSKFQSKWDEYEYRLFYYEFFVKNL